MKISIITPCYNAERSIRQTVESVVGQSAVRSGRVELEYIICDGSSTDRTLDIVNPYRNDTVNVVSEPDRGMYDALTKGLRRATGDIVAYLNAGDYYHGYAFDVVLDIFELYGVKWLTGCNVFYNERSQITGMTLPFKYRKRFFDCGMYGKYLLPIQQESTFWSSSLNRVIDLDLLSRLRLAGDFYLWSRFSTVAELNIVESYLGGFKFHGGQLSEDREAYLRELRELSRRPRPYEYLLAFMDRVLFLAPSKMKKSLNRNHLFRYDHSTQSWS